MFTETTHEPSDDPSKSKSYFLKNNFNIILSNIR